MIVKSFEGVAGLDKRRDAAGQAVGFRVPLAKLGREHIGQFDLADLGLDLRVRHLGIEIMLKSLLAEQSDEKLLCQIRVGVVLAFFDQKTGSF